MTQNRSLSEWDEEDVIYFSRVSEMRVKDSDRFGGWQSSGHTSKGWSGIWTLPRLPSPYRRSVRDPRTARLACRGYPAACACPYLTGLELLAITARNDKVGMHRMEGLASKFYQVTVCRSHCIQSGILISNIDALWQARRVDAGLSVQLPLHRCFRDSAQRSRFGERFHVASPNRLGSPLVALLLVTCNSHSLTSDVSIRRRPALHLVAPGRVGASTL
jgi:hypothetical protein